MIDISTFVGEIPKLSEKLLPGEYAAQAVNCNLESGNLQPVKGVATEQALESGAETIYRLGEQWLQWNNKINVIESLVQNSGGRIVYTGDHYPKETNVVLGLVSSPFPTNSRRLGIAAPTSKLTTTVNTAGSGSPRDISYCFTRVGVWEDGTIVESAPSPASDLLTANDDATVDVSGFTAPTEDGVYDTHYHLYRINAGLSGTEYQFVAQISKSASFPYVDSVEDDDLGEVLPTTGWTVPIDDLKGIISTSNGLAFAFNDNTVYVSESYIAYTFPVDYTLSVGSEIVGLAFNGNAVVVLTKTAPSLIYGSEPESLSLDKLSHDLPLPCKSERSIVSTPDGVIFASATGLFMINSGGNAINLTKNIFTKEQWEALGPGSVFAFYFNDAYVAFFAGSTVGIEVDPSKNYIRRFSLTSAVHGGQYVSTVSINTYNLLTSGGDNFLTADGYQLSVTGSSYSITSDTLYLIQSTDTGRAIVSWEAGSLVDYTWKSKEVSQKSYHALTAGMLIGNFSEGSTTLKLYVDGVLSFTKTISGNDVFRIRSPKRGSKFQVELTGKATIDRMILGTSVNEVIEEVEAA